MEVRPGSHVFELLEIGFTLENLDMKLTNSLAGEREETKKNISSILFISNKVDYN